MEVPRRLFVIFCILYLQISLGVAQAEDRRRTTSTNPIISSLSPPSGQQGQTITLKGQNFGSRKGKIFFGSTELAENEIASWKDTTVTTTIPEGRDQVDVQLMTSRERKSNKLSFTYASNNTGTNTGLLTNFKVLANNDLGMHCVDDDFSVFSILPPYNTVNVQVVAQNPSGIPQLVGKDAVILRYSPILKNEATGEWINSTSIGKSNFWNYLAPIF